MFKIMNDAYKRLYQSSLESQKKSRYNSLEKIKSSYQTKSNRSKYFQVDINQKDKIAIVKFDHEYTTKTTFRSNLEFDYKKVFVGKSDPNNEPESRKGKSASCYYNGEEYDGNTLLFEIAPLTYLYVGEKVYLFESLYPITRYVSIVGNNEYNYPYAVDQKGNYYLMISYTVFKPQSCFENINEDVYDEFYRLSFITKEMSCGNPRPPAIEGFQNIEEYYIDDERYMLTYDPFPEKDYERISRNWIPGAMSIKKKDGTIESINMMKYCKIMKDFGDMIGFQPMNIKKEISQFDENSNMYYWNI